MPQPFSPRNVFLVDDEEQNLLLFAKALPAGEYALHRCADGRQVLDLVAAGVLPDIVVSDVMMPRMDGFELCLRLKADPLTRLVPVILVTGLEDVRDKLRGLECGADDFLTKPFHPAELRTRIRSLIRIKTLHDEVEHKNRLLEIEKGALEERVRTRTSELERLTLGLVAALEKANELNDTDTGLHILRVCAYSRALAFQMGMEAGWVSRLHRYASLHDVGKVGIPDSVLKKQGNLTDDEFELMMRHTVFGHELLVVAGADEMACNIALCHHERYDGTGYPNRLAGDAIPLEARIVALADVYDALTTRRCYKEAYTTEEAERTIRAEAGRHFDPSVVDAMVAALDSFEAIRRLHDDADG